jgi:M6 family metalloprotease-like protein
LKAQVVAVVLLIVAATMLTPAYATSYVKPRVVYAPNLLGFSPIAEGDDDSSDVSISNVTAGPILGTIRVAVILAQFDDVPANRTSEQIQQDYFGGNYSVAAYYHTVSYGKVTLTGDVFGWYTLPYPEAHYGKDCLTVDDAACDGSDASWQIAQDAVAVAEKDTGTDINFMNYDYYVFVHSGYGEESSGVKNDVWSVTYLGGVWIQTNSKTITRFNVTPELEAGGAVPLGVYCHEFGHNLGLPDMYDTHTGKSRMGRWELMDKGLWNGKPPGSEPAELSAWSRNRLGWLPAANIVTYDSDSDQLMTMQPLEEAPSNGTISAVIVPLATKEYYLFENREPISNDAYLPDEGIVGYHIDENKNFFSTIESPADDAAYHLGDLLSYDQLKAKVIASYSNSSLLVGFGDDSALATQEVSSLTLKVTPDLAVTVVINNQSYTTNQTTGTVTVTSDFNNETFDVTVPKTVNLQPGVRVEFQSWENGDQNDSRPVLVTSNTTVTASYKTQFLVSVTSQYGAPSGSGWYDENTPATVSINSTVDGAPGTRYVFYAWEGDASSSNNQLSFSVTQPMNLSAVWTTFEWMQLAFYDVNSAPTSPGIVDTITLRAPNGSVLVLSGLSNNSAFWFQKGTYGVLTAYVYGVDCIGLSEQFTTSPNGVASIALQLDDLSFKVTDYLFNSPLNGGNVTITLPNGVPETAPITNGDASFNDLPQAVYPFTISRDWTLGASGEVTFSSQNIATVPVIVISSLLMIVGSIVVAILASFLVLRRLRSSDPTRSSQHSEELDDGYSDYWNHRNEK